MCWFGCWILGWFEKCRNYCVDTSWPPESSMHPTRGAYWISSLQKTACPPATQSTGSIAIFYTIEIPSFAPLTVTLTLSLCLSERQEITQSINIHTGQIIPQLGHRKLRPSDWMVCWHPWEPEITCDTYSRKFLSMGVSWWSFSFCTHKNNIS